MRKLAIILAFLAVLALPTHSQTVQPLMGVGNVQFFNNNGDVLTAGVVYVYQAGTTTFVPVYADYTGTTQDPNPVPFTTGARASIWLASGTFVKIVVCQQNDGTFCAPSDVLFSSDQIPIPPSVNSGAGFVGIFTSLTANAATSGALRLASSDSVCWRNAANTANICFSMNSNNLLNWAGGDIAFPEIATPCSQGVAGTDLLWADNSAHRWMMNNSGAGCVQVVASGVDINTSDQVTQVHFGSTAIPFGPFPPTTGQYLQWNGTLVIGNTPEQTLATGSAGVSGGAPVCTGSSTSCEIYILANPHTLTRIVANESISPSGCSTNPKYGLYDLTSSVTIAFVQPTTGGILDSGPLSVGIPANHQIGIGVTTTGVGCTTAGTASVTATYQ